MPDDIEPIEDLEPTEPTPAQIEALENIEDSLISIYTLCNSFENVGNFYVADTLRVAYARLRTGLLTLGIPIKFDETIKKPTRVVR